MEGGQGMCTDAEAFLQFQPHLAKLAAMNFFYLSFALVPSSLSSFYCFCLQKTIICKELCVILDFTG
jgi:hypothetical protein